MNDLESFPPETPAAAPVEPAAPEGAGGEPAAQLPATMRRTAVEKVLTPCPAPGPGGPELDGYGFAFDRLLHANQGQLTGGLSPAAMSQAFSDWAIHLANAPGKQADLVRKLLRKLLRLSIYAARAPFDPGTPPAIEPLPEDRRFTGPEWQQLPFSLYYQSFLMVQQWWHNATTHLRGVDPGHLAIVNFTIRQILDVYSPSNFVASNPEVLQRTLQTGGVNLWRGLANLVDDAERRALGQRPVGAEAFAVGQNVAVTPGVVVFRNRLMELIQYAPATAETRPEPILIIPAWIMKYYILDLSATNSLIRYLVEKGHTVFCLSWKNPLESDRDLGMDDYVEHGAMAALQAVRAIVPDRKVHLVGYCLGGTLASVVAATLARDREDWLRTMTLFAAQVDFTEAGELLLFINPSQIAYLEDMMWDQGYLDTRQMSGAFQLLRSNDLIWSSMVRQYLLAERTPMNDLMAWNADQTRMPYRMHSEYLRHLFLENDLAAGRYSVDGRPLSLADIRVPIFTVATTHDHIAPWPSVFKVTWLTQSNVTFVLTNGGHNAGIVSPPGGKTRRHYWINTTSPTGIHLDHEGWLARATRHEGSWWPAWTNWLGAYSGDPIAPPPLGAPDQGYAPLCAAPGSYVLAP